MLAAGAVNVVDEARQSHGWDDWVFLVFAAPMFAFLIGVFAYWATLKEW